MTPLYTPLLVHAHTPIHALTYFVPALLCCHCQVLSSLLPLSDPRSHHQPAAAGEESEGSLTSTMEAPSRQPLPGCLYVTSSTRLVNLMQVWG